MKNLELVTSENKYNLLSGRLSLLLNKFLSQQFKKKGLSLTREQWSVLAVLWKNDGCAQQVIADDTNRDKPSVTRLIDNLVKEGYVLRKNDENDRRLNLIFLTEKGKNIEKEVMEVVDDTINKATKDLTNDQIVAVRVAFQIVYDNIKVFVK
ncbi:MarR family winged helix-turn-helix transcriptional regulator [Flavobacterium azooxidireducens]|uniref:MarR family winged helix-turn-helix transcriptional regulator n=1 Tax=Flavobacterium azooxidireducens TaxID=1871076 RepID=A0ABY4KCD3_9FLAO|nr:MarR family winged helix-turn-helix transcriptional regulator [Flavobacterium azooxidireducens]UPQ77970.1 MarR family winged helix-turn-helix transcriptional regulator [Flavobacterium azooxidireducens]